MKTPWYFSTVCICSLCQAQQSNKPQPWDCTTAPQAVLDPILVVDVSCNKDDFTSYLKAKNNYDQGLCSITDELAAEINYLKSTLNHHYRRNSPSDPTPVYNALCQSYKAQLELLRARAANGLPAQDLHHTELEYALVRIGHPTKDPSAMADAEAAANAIFQDTQDAYNAGMADAVQRYKAQITVNLVAMLRQQCEQNTWEHQLATETQNLYDSLQQLCVRRLKEGLGSAELAISATISSGKFRRAIARNETERKQAQQKLVQEANALLLLLQDKKNQTLIPAATVEDFRKQLQIEQENLELMRK